ncbi:MAG: hypothetical protein H0V21_05625 [Rubrobacter sp.]|nr:hypothetical protein [Rubrobacter sp.]
MRIGAVTRWISFVLMALPVVAGFLYVYLFGVDVVYNDEWEMVSLFVGPSSAKLTILDLWEQHLEHRFFFPGGSILLLGILTKWNTVAEMYLIQVCLLVTLVVLYLAFRAGTGTKPLYFVPVAFLVFSLVQSFNMLWGLQLTFFFVETFGVLTFFFLYLSGGGGLERFAFPAALLSGTVAAFSAIQGLLVWPVGLLYLFVISVEGSTRRLLVAVWGLIGLGEWVVYFTNYTFVSNSASAFYPLTHPLAGTRYFLSLLGSSLFLPRWGSFLALTTGLLMAGLVAVSLIVIYRNRRVREYSFWMALLLFSLLVLVAITAGRSGAQGLSAPRYATFPILATVCVYVMLARLFLEDRSRAVGALFGLLCVVVLLSVPVSYYKGIGAGNDLKNRKEQAAYILSTYTSQPDRCLQLVRQKNTDTVRRFAPQLKRLGYSVFSEPRVPLPPRRFARECPGPSATVGMGFMQRHFGYQLSSVS